MRVQVCCLELIVHQDVLSLEGVLSDAQVMNVLLSELESLAMLPSVKVTS